MEIGFPTDVKHVAHIGWDGPSESAPGWVHIALVIFSSSQQYNVLNYAKRFQLKCKW